MKKLIFIIGFLTAITTLCCCDSDILELDDNQENKLIIHKSKLQNKEFVSDALTNNVIGNSNVRKMQVYTPPGYDRKNAQGYPVVYLLHGLPFSEKSFIDKKSWEGWVDPNGVFKNYPDFPEEGFKDWMDELILTKKIAPIIIVMPNAASAYGFSFYSNSILNGNFEDYIANDLVNYIDNRYNTITNKNGRAVIGFSQGGYGAVKLGMKHSDKFGVVASHSAPLFFQAFPAYIPQIINENPDGMIGPDPSKFLTSAMYAMSAAWSPNLNNPPFMVDLFFEYPSGEIIDSVLAQWLENDPYTMLDIYGNDFKSLNGIYFDVGELDEFGWGLTYDYFIQKLDAMGIDHTSAFHDGGHFDKMFSRLKISLEFCSENMNK